MTKPNDRTPKDFLDWLNIRNLPDWTKSRRLGALVTTVLALLFVMAFVALVAVLVHTIRLSMAEGSEGPNLGAGALIAALLGAPFVIWGTWLKHRTVTFQKEGHITDRINTAVEMLGAEKTVKRRDVAEDGTVSTAEETVPNIEVRIGAILSLERIAQDSTAYDKGRDHVRVMEILCAYVRENSNARKPVDFPELEWVSLKDGASKAERDKHLENRQRRFGSHFRESLAWTWARAIEPPRADVDQALKVLGRRTAAQRRVEAAWPNPPSETTVWPFDQPCPELPAKENGEPSTKEEIAAFKAQLAAWKETLSGYSGYQLDLTGANLQRADLSGAVLSGAKLSGARMEGAYLRGARMDASTSLTAALLRGAAVKEVDYTNVGLSQDQIDQMFGDGSVRWPNGVNRLKHWPDWEMGWDDFHEEWEKWQADPENYVPPPKPEGVAESG
ncbi:pentapeptide repeat-containing protein [Thioclava sp. FR2]|uniref:pentapeptide repeat-containing protein n=1 Tax=Thioclava sp. FR2 TaxID=3445780 RepID=UPI003EBE230E